MKLLIAYQVNGGEYWYLTKFLEMQRLRQKSKIPCPPWLYWEPETGCVDTSKGKYKVNHEKLTAFTNSVALDIKPPPEVSRGEESGEEIKITDSACAFQDNDKQRFTQALKDVLADIGSMLVVDKCAQKLQIITSMKGRKYPEGQGLNELWKRFDIEPVDNSWQVYERIVK